MLTKLVKYDLLFGLKRYGVLLLLLCGTWISGLVISLINNSFLNGTFLLLNIVISALFIAAYITNSLQLFYNALTGEESYLNYTIPVNTSNLVLSKLIAIWTWGAVMAGALVLAWASLYNTLLYKMGIKFPIQSDFLNPLINISITQFLTFSCLVAFSISLFNTPKLKTTNSGMAVVAVVAYVLAQVVSFIQLGVIALFLYIDDPLLLKSLLGDNLTPEQEIILINSMQGVVVASSLILAIFFFWLTVKTVSKRRSV